jgi:putative two-component system response regulator
VDLPKQQTSSATRRVPLSPATILIVDDLPGSARLLDRLLEGEGYRITMVHDGAQALAAVTAEHPDLILMDVMMPTLDGFETCRRLKNDPATRLVPIVLITSLQDSRDRIKGLDAGADDFVIKPVNAPELKARLRSLLRIKRYTDDLDSAESVIVSLALTIEARDACTDGHCQRLAAYAAAVGQQLGLGEADVSALRKGGFLHDIGKIGIPDAILLKPTALTREEFAVMQQHTVIGDRLCGELRSLRMVRPIVRHHHERLDGSGYPDGLAGDAIPLLAQIMSVVDVFDALTTERPYKRSRRVPDALEEIEREVRLGWRPRSIVHALRCLVGERRLPALSVDASSGPVAFGGSI